MILERLWITVTIEQIEAQYMIVKKILLEQKFVGLKNKDKYKQLDLYTWVIKL